MPAKERVKLIINASKFQQHNKTSIVFQFDAKVESITHVMATQGRVMHSQNSIKTHDMPQNFTK